MSALIEGDDNEDIHVEGNVSSASRVLQGSRNKRVTAKHNQLGAPKPAKDSSSKSLLIGVAGAVIAAIILGVLYNRFGWTFLRIS